jgi:hypothetical protein
MMKQHLKGQCHEIFDFWYFSLISFPQAQPLSVPLGPFRIFSKTRGDTVFAAQGLPPVSLTPVANAKNLQSKKL